MSAGARRPTYEFFLWRGDHRIGTLRFGDDIRVIRGMSLSLFEVADHVTGLTSVTQLYSDGQAFEQDTEPRIPTRRSSGDGTGGTFALRPMDRITSPDRKYTVRDADGDTVTLESLSLTEIVLPEDWGDDPVGFWSASDFPNGHRWEVVVVAGPEFSTPTD